MTNFRSLSDLFKAAMKLAAACAFMTAIAAAVSAQTNTFPTTGNAARVLPVRTASLKSWILEALRYDLLTQKEVSTPTFKPSAPGI